MDRQWPALWCSASVPMIQRSFGDALPAWHAANISLGFLRGAVSPCVEGVHACAISMTLVDQARIPCVLAQAGLDGGCRFGHRTDACQCRIGRLGPSPGGICRSSCRHGPLSRACVCHCHCVERFGADANPASRASAGGRPDRCPVLRHLSLGHTHRTRRVERGDADGVNHGHGFGCRWCFPAARMKPGNETYRCAVGKHQIPH